MANIKQHPGVSSTTVEGESIRVDHNGATMITLNHLGGLLWDQLAESRSLDDLVDWCEARYPDVGRETLEKDASAFLSHVAELDLVIRTD